MFKLNSDLPDWFCFKTRRRSSTRCGHPGNHQTARLVYGFGPPGGATAVSWAAKTSPPEGASLVIKQRLLCKGGIIIVTITAIIRLTIIRLRPGIRPDSPRRHADRRGRGKKLRRGRSSRLEGSVAVSLQLSSSKTCGLGSR